MTRFEGRADDRDGVDWRSVRRGAPWLDENRARYWAKVITADVEAGRYTHMRMMTVTDEIRAEKEGER